MTLRLKLIALPLLAALLVAAGSLDPGPETPVQDKPKPPAFIEAVCGSCHAVETPYLSPVPEAPTFDAIANRKGLSHKALKPWLLDAHLYPVEMEFELEPHHVDLVARYLLAMRREDIATEQ